VEKLCGCKSVTLSSRILTTREEGVLNVDCGVVSLLSVLLLSCSSRNRRGQMMPGNVPSCFGGRKVCKRFKIPKAPDAFYTEASEEILSR